MAEAQPWTVAGSRIEVIAAVLAVAVAATSVPLVAPVHADRLAEYQTAGDAIPDPLGGHLGDASRGRDIVLDRTMGNCLICHVVPEPTEAFMGEIGPDLTGVGKRLTPAQIRLRIVDQSQLNPATMMPPYYRTTGLTRVGADYRGKPVLSASEVEDVVAYLATLTQ